MDWLFLSLLGAASLAVTGVIDKFILGRYARDPLAYLAALVAMQQILIVAIPAYLGWGFVYPQTLYALAAGSFQVVLWAAYLLALQVEETSRVAALVYVFPIFVFLGAYLFLGETLAANDYAGGALLVCSALLISYRPAQGGGPAILSPALKYMAVFWVFTAAYALAAKYQSLPHISAAALFCSQLSWSTRSSTSWAGEPSSSPMSQAPWPWSPAWPLCSPS